MIVSVLFAIAVILGVYLLVFGPIQRRKALERAALRPDPNLDLLVIPEFELVDQDGEPFTRASLEGQITVLDFFFSRCPLACVPMSNNMKAAQDALAGTGVRFVSVSVDPAHDTPETMRAYADRIGAHASTWSFLTGDPAVIRSLAKKATLFDVEEEPGRVIEAIGGGEMANIAHPVKFYLVGPDARIIAFYDGLSPDDVPRLAERARLAAKAAGRPEYQIRPEAFPE